MSTAEITGEQINKTLRTVKAMSENGDAQLSILSRAFVIACKSCQVGKDVALANVAALFDEEMALVPLDDARARTDAGG